nr:pesticin C-terminus-like muramidase [uncultured Erwinia sp.]
MKMVLPIDGYRSAKEFMAAMQGSEGDTHWLMKQAEHWHGGIHLCDGFAGNTVFKPDSHGLKCMTDGQVVAWRLNDDYQTATYGKKTLKFSSTFVLIRSTCTPDKNNPDNALDFFTLWMQIAPLSEYGITDTPTATVTANALKIRQDNTSLGWIRSGLREGVNVPRDSLRYYEVPQDTQTTLPRGAVVEIKQEASFLLYGKPAPFIFVSVVSVPEATKSGLSVGESGWISGLDKFVKRQGNASPAWMQAARQYGVFNKVVTVSGEDALTVKAGEIIGHLSLNERPSGGPQHFCHLEVFSQDTRIKDFLANKAGVMTGAAELHTLADKTRWKHREQDNSFVVAGVGGDPSPTTAERYTPESECRRLEADGKTWYYIPGELAWMAAEDVERANQFDLEKRGFMPLEQEDAPESIFQTPKESWLHQVYGQLEALARSETRDMYSSSYTEQYQKLLKQMDLNQDGVIDAGELWRFLHNTQPHIQHQVQRFVVKHHSEWLKDGMSALWQAALDEQAKKYPDMALYNRDFINKLVWMKDVPEVRSSEALWHMHPIVFLDAIRSQKKILDGQLTYNAEGNDISSSIYYSRVIHWPGNDLSGVTLGRGYDMGDRTEVNVYSDMVASGIPNEQADKISKGAGLKGNSARDFILSNKSDVGEITLQQQKSLFAIIYPKYVERAISNYGKWTNGVLGAKPWEELDSTIQEVLVDFVYQGFTKGPKPMLAGSNNNKQELISYIRNSPSISQYEPGRHRANYLEESE